MRCSRDLTWAQKANHLSNFTKSMQYSGYGQKFRAEIIRSALTAYKTVREEDEKGKKPLYRKKEWKRMDRERGKRRKKQDWFKKGGAETVVFVPATPNSILKKKYEDEINNTGIKMKVVERRGLTLLSKLKRGITLTKGCREN